MKNSGKIIIFSLLLLFSCTVQRRPYFDNRDNLSMQYFYDELSPYGYWVYYDEYGYVWIPDAGRNFYPYETNGQWVMTEYGWTWVSGYEWGWAPFHYGRWDYDDVYGWFWLPDNEWGPGWVNWRSGNGYFGWSPMTPGSRGMNYQSSMNDPYRWIFVRDRDFGKPNISMYHVNPRRNMEIYGRTRIIDNRDNISTGRTVINSGPDPGEVQRSTGRRVNTVTVRDNDRPGSRLNSNELRIYRPRVQSNDEAGNKPAPSRITDIKDVRPTRERDREYRPGNQSGEVRPEINQGRSEQSVPEIKSRETQRQSRREATIDSSRNRRTERESTSRSRRR